MVKVVVVNGMPGCGKTIFEEMCKNIVNEHSEDYLQNGRFLFIQILSTIDFVKSIARECGWDGTKTPENRRFLSDLKDLLTRWNDVPFKVIKEQIDRDYRLGFNTIFFVDCREPTEIQKLKETFNATTLIIRRESVEYDDVSNHADADVFYYDYDLTIYNNSDIIHLENEARKFIEYMKKDEVPHYEYAD